MSSALLCFATQPGRPTLDRDIHGGNPFASALIECIPSIRTLSAAQLLKKLKTRTHQLSDRQQSIDWDAAEKQLNEPVVEGSTIALALICHNYTQVSRLPGASYDKERITKTLAAIEITVEQNSEETRNGLLATLSAFSKISAGFDTAIIYSTGHGLQHFGVQYLVPTDFVLGSKLTASTAVSVAEMLESCNASKRNLVFFAGCRDEYKSAG